MPPDAFSSHDRRAAGLVDVLDRVLDKGLIVAGDVRISLADVELLTIRIRLLVCSIDKAREIGLDWWRHDPHLSLASSGETEALRERVRMLEDKIALLDGRAGGARKRSSRKR